MNDGADETKRLLAVTILWLLVGVVNIIVLGLLLLDKPAGGGWAVRVGLTATCAALAFAVAVRFARQRQRQLEARLDGDRSWRRNDDRRAARTRHP